VIVMKIVDMKEMPGFNPAVKNGTDSVSTGKVYLRYKPTCATHGAMNKMSKFGIWRCIMCNEGCYENAPVV